MSCVVYLTQCPAPPAGGTVQFTSTVLYSSTEYSAGTRLSQARGNTSTVLVAYCTALELEAGECILY